MSLTASLIGLQQGGPAKFREPVEEKFSNWAGSMSTEHSLLRHRVSANERDSSAGFFLSWFKVESRVAHRIVSSLKKKINKMSQLKHNMWLYKPTGEVTTVHHRNIQQNQISPDVL